MPFPVGKKAFPSNPPSLLYIFGRWFPDGSAATLFILSLQLPPAPGRLTWQLFQRDRESIFQPVGIILLLLPGLMYFSFWPDGFDG